MKKILVLTSSRADFGIYLPLLKKINSSKSLDLELLAFGTHLSKFHGYTVEQIKEEGLVINYTISSMVLGDLAGDISNSYALTAQKFADFWSANNEKFDWVFVLGDRFEMAAAVAAGIPFNINFAHIHGGETTIGAIDNIYRHSISLASKLHFVALHEYKERVVQLLGHHINCQVVGALSLDNLQEIQFLNIKEFKKKWEIDLSIPTILITVHPETVSSELNQSFSNELYRSLSVLAEIYQLVITMPNADTLGSLYRAQYAKLKQLFPDKIFLVENFGTQSYFTAMKNAALMVGNTSSGIIEAASFEKYVINVGDRQKGRIIGENVIDVKFESAAILKTIDKLGGKKYKGKNIYHSGNVADKIIQIIESV